MNKYDELLPELWEIEEWFEGVKVELTECENKFSDSYRSNYVGILFEFYCSTKNFYELIDETLDTNNEDDIDLLMKEFKTFLDCYSRLLRFFEFANVKEPDNFWLTFNQWKNKYWDVMECYR